MDFLNQICFFCTQKSQDKTSKACGRRLKYVMKNAQTCLNVRMYVGESNQDQASNQFIFSFIQVTLGPSRYLLAEINNF